MLKTKKLYRLMAGLLAALMICASVPSVAYATEGGAATVKVQMYLNTDGRELGDFEAELEAGKSYTLSEMAAAAGYVLPVDYEENDPGKTYEAVDGMVYDIAMKTKVTEVETATVKVQMYLNTDGRELGDFEAKLEAGKSYTLSEMAAAAGYVLPVDYEENDPGKTYEAVDGMVYDIAMKVKKAEIPAESVNIRFEFVDVNGVELRAASNVGTTWADGDTAPALASLVADEIKAVEANGYKFDYMTLVYDDGTESSSLQEPVVVPDYDGKTIKVYFSKIDTPVDVNFRVEFVDKNGNTLQEATNIAITYSDFGSSQKLSELLTDDIARVEAKGYKHFAYTLIYDDGSESSSIVDPVVVPDYNGKTIKAYFAKAEETEDVNIRFEFVDMAGETILPATNYATTYTDSEIGPKLSGVVSNEIITVEAKGYKFVMFTLVYDDDSESSALADPVVVPDYDGKTIKVYFAEADTYEDVNIRFEFVDMTGETILPATNYATTYTDSAIGPKLIDVIAEETAKLSKDSYVFDHFAWVYADGTETELNDPVIVPDYHNTTIKIYYAQPAHYRFTFINDKTGEVIADTLDVKIADVKTNVDKYVLDLVARERSIVEEAGWTYVGIRNAYNDDEYAQNDSLVVPGGPYEYKVYFTREDPVPEEPENPGTEEPSNPGNGGSNSSNSSNGGSGSDASKSDAPADNSSKILPKTGYGEGTVPVIGITAIALAAVCGAAGYVFIARRRVR